MDFTQLANQYATDAAKKYEQSLSGLVTGLENTQSADMNTLQSKYDQLINQINQQYKPLETNYAGDTRAAYVNKMLAGQQLGSQLSQLGLTTQGSGVTAGLQNEAAYGQNLTALTTQYNDALQKLANQKFNTEGERQTAINQLNADYMAKKLELEKYTKEGSQNAYNQAYNQQYAALQDAWQREMEQKQYEESIRQYNASLAEQKRQANMSYAQQQQAYNDSLKPGGKNFDPTNPTSWSSPDAYKYFKWATQSGSGLKKDAGQYRAFNKGIEQDFLAGKLSQAELKYILDLIG